MKILLTNKELIGATGTETLIRDLSVGLRRSGHTVVIYAPKTGRPAATIRATGTPVATSVLDIAEPPDIIHGHHTGPTMTALVRFRNVPAVFACHDFSSAYDDPPVHPRIRRYLYVRPPLKGRMSDERGIEPAQTTLWLNTIDLHRVGPAAPVPAVLRTAAIFAHPGAITYLESLAEICKRAGIEFKGEAIRKITPRPLDTIRDIDLVFASGRMAIEALAAGHAVVVADRFGIGGLVTLDRLDDFGQWNFAIGGLSAHPELSGLEAALAAYNPTDAASVCQRIRSDWCVEKGVERLEQIYREVLRETQEKAPDCDLDAESIAMAKFMEKYMHDLRLYDHAFFNKLTGHSDFQASMENLNLTSIELMREVQKLRRGTLARRFWAAVFKRV